MSTDAEKFVTPKSSVGDKAHAITKAGLSTIPIIGGPAAELFAMVIMPPLQKRQVEWMESVAEGLRRLETEKGINLEELQHNDTFIDIVMQASSAALRSSQKEKKEALRNAVLNSALGISVDESLQHLFLNLIDSFNQFHLLILKFFQSPTKWAQHHNVSFGSLYMGAPSHILY
ncbi:MAG: hypothetical protein WAW37_20685 [Syntrophobacteraceae bacterium]